MSYPCHICWGPHPTGTCIDPMLARPIVTVHVLDAGQPLCGFTTELPGQWPMLHIWCRRSEVDATKREIEGPDTALHTIMRYVLCPGCMEVSAMGDEPIAIVGQRVTDPYPRNAQPGDSQLPCCRCHEMVWLARGSVATIARIPELAEVTCLECWAKIMGVHAADGRAVTLIVPQGDG